MVQVKGKVETFQSLGCHKVKKLKKRLAFTLSLPSSSNVMHTTNNNPLSCFFISSRLFKKNKERQHKGTPQSCSNKTKSQMAHLIRIQLHVGRGLRSIALLVAGQMSLEGVRSGTLDATGTALEIFALGVLADDVALEVMTTSKGPLALGTILVLVGALEGAETRVGVAVGAQVKGAREGLAALGALVARLGVRVTHLLSGDHARGLLRGNAAATSLLGGLEANLGG